MVKACLLKMVSMCKLVGRCSPCVVSEYNQQMSPVLSLLEEQKEVIGNKIEGLLLYLNLYSCNCG